MSGGFREKQIERSKGEELSLLWPPRNDTPISIFLVRGGVTRFRQCSQLAPYLVLRSFNKCDDLLDPNLGCCRFLRAIFEFPRVLQPITEIAIVVQLLPRRRFSGAHHRYISIHGARRGISLQLLSAESCAAENRRVRGREPCIDGCGILRAVPYNAMTLSILEHGRKLKAKELSSRLCASL